MDIKSIGIFCGSKNGNNELYCTQAAALGRILAERGITLIYGGGRNGLMGAAANKAMEHGGSVTGIIPELLVQWESQHDAITELIVVEDMHIRKRRIYELCDAAIVLPGGFGTLDELFELLTWNQLSIHDKKIFLLNTAGFYNSLITHLKQMADEGFLYFPLDEVITVLDNPEALTEYLDISANEH